MLLLTGSTGFLGSAIARALHDAGTPFVALVREDSDTSPLQQLGADLRVGDINDPQSLLEAFAGIDTIVHTAAVVSFQPGDRPGGRCAPARSP